MSIDMTSYAFALKTVYPQSEIENLAMREHPFLAMVKKVQKGGEYIAVSCQYSNGGSSSSTYSTAMGISSSVSGVKFLLTRAKNYDVRVVDNETVLASKGNSEAILEAARGALDSGFAELGNRVGRQLYRSGSGSIARLSAASGTGTTLTLLNPEDSYLFGVGMYLESNNTDDSTSVKTSSNSVITAIDHDAGTLTISNAIGSLAASDWLFQRGDAGSSIKGLSAWIPYDDRSTVLAASFFGVTRSADSNRLGGLILDASAMSKEEAIIKSVTKITLFGGKPDFVLMNPLDYQELLAELSSKVVYDKVSAGVDGQISFEAVKVAGGIKVIQDADCPYGRMFVLTSKSWVLYHLGAEPIFLFEGDGNSSIRSSTEDGITHNINSYAQLACIAPAHNCHVKLR